MICCGAALHAVLHTLHAALQPPGEEDNCYGTLGDDVRATTKVGWAASVPVYLSVSAPANLGQPVATFWKCCWAVHGTLSPSLSQEALEAIKNSCLGLTHSLAQLQLSSL